ncbi:MAG TPA: hypothetical protein VMW24_22710 [Sedimentisphaerales bacterium]|nr:hypothetical protein [Sedimentisphaerales bacterium]
MAQERKFTCPRNLSPTRVFLTIFLVLFAALNLQAPVGQAAPKTTVSIIADGQIGPGARHGLSKVRLALEEKGIKAQTAVSLEKSQGNSLLVAGLSSGAGPAATLLESLGVSKPTEAESLLIHRTKSAGRQTLLVCGADDRGLMYALLDIADRIGWSTDPAKPFSEVRDIREEPAVAERALSQYTMHQGNFESHFYDENYWARYLDMLAKNRFNTFALLFGYENWGYVSPPYPYFFDLEEFPDIKVVGITGDKQHRNLKALNRIIEMTHERGMSFTLGIWDHIYRGGVQGPSDRANQPTDGIVWGLTADNLTAYTRAALTKLLKLVPDVDAIQFRMHGESGLKRTEMGGFWENVYAVMKEHGPNIRFDARAKNFPDSLIDKAVEMGVNMRICTKYWMEQMGLPFHPTHVHPANQHDRRHGYADLLRYPQKYKMHWRLWNCGTSRVLLWADPEYVRRFAESTHLYDGEGFEVVEPMATKMQDHPHDMKPFELLGPRYRYYDWEFERYWHFFQVFGRVGYNPRTPAEIWQKEFESRFGKQAAPFVEAGLHRASRILPYIVAYNYPYDMFPTTRGWVEKQRMKDLPEYAKALPSDTEQFLSMDAAARCILDGEDSGRIRPHQSSAWFEQISKDVLDSVRRAEQRIGTNRNKEFDSTMVDLQILAHLAQYHSHRANAGVSYALFKRSKDLNALDDAISHETSAVGAWEKLVEAAGDMYCDNLMMGRESAGLSGHWRDELVELKEGLQKLQQERDKFGPDVTGEKPTIAHVPVRRARPGEDLIVRATVSSKGPLASVKVLYRPGQGEYRDIEMRLTEPYIYRAVIPGSEIKKGLEYLIEAGDNAGRRAKTSSVSVSVTNDSEPPSLRHTPIATAAAAIPLAVTAEVSDPAGIKWVRLHYRSVNQYEDYKTIEMTPTGQKNLYQAVVPAQDVVAEYDFMYFFEVTDTYGNGRIYPELERQTPYIVVKLER